MIDAAKIEELQGLDAKATPGPWVRFSDRGATVAILPAGRSGEVANFSSKILEANAALIVAMRNALPSLLDLAASRACVGEDGGYDYVMAAETLCNGMQVWGSGTAFDKCREALQAAFEAGRDKAATRLRALASEKEGLIEADAKTRDAIGERFTLVPPDGGDVKTWEAAAALRAENERLRKALLRLQTGAAVALDALPEDQQEGVVGNFLAAIHRECCAGLCASKGADECKEATP